MSRPLFGIRLEAKRKAKGLTIEDLADEVDVSPITIFRWQKGTNIPEAKHIRPLIDNLEFTEEELSHLFEEYFLNKENANIDFRVQGYDYVERNFESWEQFLDHLIDIDMRLIAISPEIEGTSHHWAPIFQEYPFSWKLITHLDVIVGYWHYIPIKEKYFEMVKSGQLKEAEIDRSQIETLIEEGEYKMFVSMVVVDAPHRGPKANSALKKSFTKEFLELARRGYFFSEICTYASTHEGIDLCNIMGMKRIGVSLDDEPIFHTTGYQIWNKGMLSKNLKIRNLYQDRFASEKFTKPVSVLQSP